MTCPICQKPADASYRPFCSKRCADIDLGRWLNESYAIPVPEDEEESAPDGQDRPGGPGESAALPS